MTDSLTGDLGRRGYVVESTEVNARGRVLLTITGPGLEHFPIYQTEAQELADGRVTVDELRASRARVADAKR